MTVGLWEALAGRAPGQPAGPADPDLWAAVVERLNAARAKPLLRQGIEHAELTSVRGVPYLMLKSPDRKACYLRLSPQEWQLAALMDGTRTVARLVADLARITGQLAPDTVTRLVANLAANRMLEELPLDAFRPLQRVRRRPWPARLGRAILAAAKGQRLVLANVDPLLGLLYKAGGRLLFTRPAVLLMAIVALAGLGLFGVTWWRGDQSLFLTDNSYATGAAVLLGLNVVALACHELGHGLAAKHAGRRVPAAGFLIYFGIPSVFVDTTDVWMSGRRARLMTTAAGPAAGLVLAGAAQITGFLVPELAPWTFKLSFAWYLNALLNLNPFLALDGYYLLMDWLELPNLRARGLAWVAGRLRRRPPRWSQLDREGRLIAIYGALALVWLVIALNLAYRIYSDRVSGLIIGLWHTGWAARLLLIAVVVGLAAPVVHALAGWIGRLLRRWRQRRHAAGLPQRLEALRLSTLGDVAPDRLAGLAEHARWIYPRPGERLDLNGRVLVVVSGAVEGRKLGDRPGSARERVSAGGLVRAKDLVWHTAGTSLLELPEGLVEAAIGTPPAQLESLLPGLAPDFARRAESVHIAAGGEVAPAPDHAVVIASGVVLSPDGQELRQGAIFGPDPRSAGVARSPVQAFIVPVAGFAFKAIASGSPAAGVHPMTSYPPLKESASPSQVDFDGETDARLERRLRRMLVAFLLLALLLTGTHLVSGPVWAEMPADRALLTVENGVAEVNGAGAARRGERYVGQADRVRVQADSLARLTTRGGNVVVLCGGSDLTIGPLWNGSGRLELNEGRILADAVVAMTVGTPRRDVENVGAARFAAGTDWARASTGQVRFGTRWLSPDGSVLSCGSGPVVELPSSTPSAEPTPSAAPTPSLAPIPSDSPSVVVTQSKTPSKKPSTGPPKTTAPPPVDRPPTLGWVRQPERTIDQRLSNGNGCNNTATTRGLMVSVSDDHDPVSALVVRVHWSGVGPAGSSTVTNGSGSVGPIPYNTATWEGGTLAIWVTATDTKGNTSRLDGNAMTVLQCHI